MPVRSRVASLSALEQTGLITFDEFNTWLVR